MTAQRPFLPLLARVVLTGSSCLLISMLSTGCSGPDDSDLPDIADKTRPTEQAQMTDSTQSPQEHESPAISWFEDVAATADINFVHDCGFDGKRYLMPESLCGGAALLDYDNDGDLDIYLTQSGSLTDDESRPSVNQLYRNDGDWLFINVTTQARAGDDGYGMGVACGDYDNDGDTDMYICNVGRNTLLRNNGDGTFDDVTLAARVGDDGFGSSAAFVDYDNDGDLDLFTLNYLNWSVASEMTCYNAQGAPDYCSPKSYKAAAEDVLYRNNGDGSFTDVTRDANIHTVFGNGLGIACSDFDKDGFTDIFIANDGMPDQMWINNGNGTFKEFGARLGCALDDEGSAKAGMGVTLGDIDFDGDTDLLVCNLFRESDSFYRNDGRGYFDAVTAMSGLANTSRFFTRFGVGWFDFDNDGLLDMYQANGRVMRQTTSHSDDPYAEPNSLFIGKQGNEFTPIKFKQFEPAGGTVQPLIAASRAAAFGDIDNDGGIDIVVSNRDGSPHVLRNAVPDRGHWITLRVLDEHSRDAFGARVTIEAGDREMHYEVRAASSYMASNDPRIHAGLGDHDAPLDVTVQWVDGTNETYSNVDIDRVMTLKRAAEVSQ